jgi:hypothetical protein
VDGEIFIVELNADHPIPRQRFTFAHEIGHTFFFELEPNQQRVGFRLEDDGLLGLNKNRGEEYLCNVAAAEILMPYHQFFERINIYGLGSSALLALANEFNVSLQAAARRVVALSPHKLAVILWQREKESSCYRASWQVGRAVSNCSTPLRVRPSDPIFELFECRPNFSQRRWASLGGPLDNYFVDGVRLASRTTQRILTVFILDRSAEALASKWRKIPSQPAQRALF